MDLMIDTNIVLDHIGRREPFFELSRKTCLLGIVGEAVTYISASMVTDIFYLLQKDYGGIKAQEMMEDQLSFLATVGVSSDDIARAQAKRWEDFEDCLVSECAEKIKADYIVTRNVKDFSQSKVPAVTPQELFDILEKRGFAYEVLDW